MKFRKPHLVRCLLALAIVFLLAGDLFAGPVLRVVRHHRERVAERVDARRAGGGPGCGCRPCQPAPAPAARPVAPSDCPGGKCPLKR